tara:strand:- start:966 stop:1250 length:285 start_codon:yes stop_codon:yes gene_type:complete
MAQTVSECLTNAMDSVTLINSINTDASAEPKVEGMNQAEINEVVQRNVDHLEIVLAYAPVDSDDDTPDVAGSSDDKTSYTTAITTGKAYISANS